MSDASSDASSVSGPELGDVPEDVPFALAPAQAITTVIDCRSSAGRKLFEQAAKPLDEELFDCEPGDLCQFLKNLEDRAREFGWNDESGTFMIPEDHEDILESERSNLLTDCGQMDLERIRGFEESYIGNESRAAQDTHLAHRCLMNSTSKAGKDKVRIWESECKIGDRMSGNLLLKIIIRESHLDANATTSAIRTKLSQLDLCLPTIGHDILKFNQCVALLLAALKSQGETTEDLLTNLFKGHLAASDKVFVKYIERKQEQCEEGEDMSASQLMNLAGNKHKNLLQKSLWNAPSASEEKILALQAQVEALSKKSHKKTGNKGKDHDASQGAQKDGKPAWLKKHRRPKRDQLTNPRTWKGAAHCWCEKSASGKCSGKWRVHKPSQCEGREGKNKPQKNESTAPPHKKQKGPDGHPRLKLNKACQAAVDGQDSGEESQ